jgi:cytochrome c-type biogenesis protein
MILLFITAFLGGIAVILSPCVIPILPILLAGGTGGKLKPLGIVSGFIIVFTVIFVSLSALTNIIPVAPRIITVVGSVLLIAFGLVLAIPKFHMLWEVGISRLMMKFNTTSSNSSVKENSNGFVSGLGVGSSLGLVWSPCVGPVMAGVLTLSFSGGSNTASVLSAFFWSLGAGLPMLGVVYGGRAFSEKLKKFQKNSSVILQVFGVILILSGIMILSGFDKTITAWFLEILPEHLNFAENIGQNEVIKSLIDEHILNKK